MTRRYMYLTGSAVLAIAVLITTFVVRATPGGATSDSLTYAGTLTGVDAGPQTFSFILHNGVASCAVTKAADVAASGAFAVTFGASDSPCLTGFFDGGDVTVDVSVAGVTITGQPVTPVPYAKYSDVASDFAPNSPISQLVPTGTVIAFAGPVDGENSPPPGWLLCDGAAVSRSTYANLFAVIGTTVGTGNGTTTFNLPDYRGLFLRGFDHGNGVDAGGAMRTAMNVGGNTGNNVGTVQAESLASHSHAVGTTTICTAGGGICASGVVAGSGVNTTSAGGNETRPKNATVNYLIRY